MKSYEDKIKLVDKYLKANKNVVKLALIRYEGLTEYIRLDFNPKDKQYFIYSINLSWIKNNRDIPRIINRQILHKETMEFLSKLTFKNIEPSFDKLNDDEDIVYLSARFNEFDYEYKFNRYIPKKLNYFSNILIVLFSNLPKRLDIIFDELVSEINGVSYKYDYHKYNKFNIYKDDLRDIFPPEVIKDGEKYYKSNKIVFLEKNNYNRWFAYTIDKENEVLVSITPNDDKFKLKCTCNNTHYCKHIYAVIKEIRDGNIKPFYKVRMMNPNESQYDKMTSFNYLFTMGIVDDRIKVISEDGDIILVPLLNKKNELIFEVLEDDEDDTLYEAMLKVRGSNGKK